MDYLNLLNPSQREAVLHNEGPAMIIAGAGSGKTRVLTFRIAHLLSLGVDAYNILSLTFTNKAAAEMRERIEKMVGTEARSLWMGTFHSVFAKILRAESEKIGYPKNFTIYDTDDSKTLIKQILKERGLDVSVYKPGVVLSRISGAKNRMIDSFQYEKDSYFLEIDKKARIPEVGQIYKLYQMRLRMAGAMDFDDLLLNTYFLLDNHIDALNFYQDKFRYIMVDEYQDTNYIQYLIIKRLAAKYQNIVVVGDDAQSIYGFRGADIRNILNFERNYPDLKIFKLEQNYRSTDVIVQAANSIIKNNTAQLPKNVWTENQKGDLIELIEAQSDNEEGRLIATSIIEHKNREHFSNEDFAVLYRTNAQSRAIEEALRKFNVPYRIVGGTSFYQRKEVKDALAYLRLAINPTDEQALRRIINFPKRGIGDTSIAKLMLVANENNVTLWDVVSNIRAYFDAKATVGIENFAVLIKNFILYAKEQNAYEAADYIARTSGLIREFDSDKTIEGIGRYENIVELLNSIKEYVDDVEKEDKSLAAFLQEVTLLTSVDEQASKDDKTEKITLMTIHMSKGLEFKHVFIAGMEEDLFPSNLMMTSRADLEEERRLFYVAVTRAMNRLTLSYSTTRYRHGNLLYQKPSRFLEEINEQYVNQIKKVKIPSNVQNANAWDKQTYNKIDVKKNNIIKPKPIPVTQNHQLSSDFKPSDTTNLAEGMRVEHPKFGFGKVIKLNENGANRMATVNFDVVGEKTLLLAFAKLMIHKS